MRRRADGVSYGMIKMGRRRRCPTRGRGRGGGSRGGGGREQSPLNNFFASDMIEGNGALVLVCCY